MLGDDVAFVLTAEEHGVVLVHDIDELLAVAAVLATGKRSEGRRVAVVTTSGGAGSLAWVPPRYANAVIQAAEVCPGECIFIEVEVPVAAPPPPDDAAA